MDDVDSEYIQHLLSLGLERLYAISLAETYEARYELLNEADTDCPRSNFDFLHEALIDVNESNDRIPLSDFTLTEERTRLRSPFFDDPDPGPLEIWRWAHLDQTRRYFVYWE